VLYGYPIDGVVLTIGCDKTTPACLMAAATVNIPAIALSVGPMLNGWHKGERTGSGTIVWKARELLAAGEIDYQGFIKLVATRRRRRPAICNTMGTATTMNSLAEALGMSLPGSAAIPAPYRDRQESAYRTGLQIVEMVHDRPQAVSDMLTREAFENAIRRQFGDRRLDQRADPPQRDRPPYRRRTQTSTTGRRMAATCRCWSTCSRRANIWARIITAPAACPRSLPN
jgi:dihydroxy-acid dehydratase